MRGSAARVDGGWRLPAAEIERSIAAAARSILDDQQTVVSAIEDVRPSHKRLLKHFRHRRSRRLTKLGARSSLTQ
jgi:hypothetical protein